MLLENLPLCALELMLIVQIIKNPRIRRHLFSFQALIIFLIAGWVIYHSGQTQEYYMAVQNAAKGFNRAMAESSPFVLPVTGLGTLRYWKNRVLRAIFKVIITACIAGIVYLILQHGGYIPV